MRPSRESRGWVTSSPGRSSSTSPAWDAVISGEELPAGAGQKSMPKLRTSVLYHLKLAAAQLPEIAEAQARYGVALVLAGEQNLGRQFLQNAMQARQFGPAVPALGGLDRSPGGISRRGRADRQLARSSRSPREAPRELTSALHLLNGEIYQSRRSPENLRKAAAEFEKAMAAGPESSATVLVRLAQIDVQLGDYDKAIARIDSLEEQGKGSPSAIQLAVLTLEEQDKRAEARARLKAARTK